MSSGKSRRALTDEERAEKRGTERELMAKAIADLRSSEGWQRWLRVRHHFHTYSPQNQFLIAVQCPHATRVAAFRRWLGLGYAVRKGERGIRIWAPCPPSKKKLLEWRQAGANPSDRPRTYFRMVSVFDRSQVDPLPEFPGGPVVLDPPIAAVDGADLADLFGPLAGFAEEIGYSVGVEEIPGAARGYFSPDSCQIGVEVVSSTYSANAQIKTLIHELAHALARTECGEEDLKLSQPEEEVVVECVAYTVCSTASLDTSGWSVPYMASWGDGGEIERYAGLIDRLAGRLEDVVCGAGEGAVDQEAAIAA